MHRRTFALTSLAACSLSTLQTLASGGGSEALKETLPVDSHEFRFGEETEHELKSTPVRWQEGNIHLLSLNQFTFLLDSNSNRLTVNAKGSLLTFDDIDYTISVAVFAVNGSMLGASTTVCNVPRIWLGTYGQQPVDLIVDFGISNRFVDASKFQACISDRTVLTPDQWQKGYRHSYDRDITNE